MVQVANQSLTYIVCVHCSLWLLADPLSPRQIFNLTMQFGYMKYVVHGTGNVGTLQPWHNDKKARSNCVKILFSWAISQMLADIYMYPHKHYTCVFSRNMGVFELLPQCHVVILLTPLQIYNGRVTSIMQFGCFVQLEGVRGKFEGLVHVSQLRREGRVKDVTEVVKRNDKVKVKVLSISGSKLSLSMKVQYFIVWVVYKCVRMADTTKLFIYIHVCWVC